MTEKRFERIYADVDVFCRDHNAKGTSQLLEKEDYGTIVDLLNEQHEENELLKNILKDIIIQLDANHTSQTYQMTIPINKVIYNELNRRLTETSFNEELRRFLDD